jgi:hypothetical protein
MIKIMFIEYFSNSRRHQTLREFPHRFSVFPSNRVLFGFGSSLRQQAQRVRAE